MANSHDAAVNAAKQSQQTNTPADTRQWDYADQQTYRRNGGK